MKLYIFIKVQHTGDTDLGQADSSQWYIILKDVKCNTVFVLEK